MQNMGPSLKALTEETDLVVWKPFGLC